MCLHSTFKGYVPGVHIKHNNHSLLLISYLIYHNRTETSLTAEADFGLVEPVCVNRASLPRLSSQSLLHRPRLQMCKMAVS